MIEPKHKFYFEHELKETENIEEERKKLREKAGLAIIETFKDNQINLVSYSEGNIQKFNKNGNTTRKMISDVSIYDASEYFVDYVMKKLLDVDGYDIKKLKKGRKKNEKC